MHYERRVEEGSTVAGKAMFVCANRLIAYAFYLNLMELRPDWKEKRKAPEGAELTDKEER